MDIRDTWERLLAEGVSVWLGDDGSLRIDKEAPPELKDLVRQRKAEIIAVLRAEEVVNRSGLRIVRLPLGGFALAKPPGPLPEEVAAAIRTLRVDHMPLVHNDEGGRWLPYRQWLCRQPACDREDLLRWRREREAEEQARLERRRRKSA
jgi:hypothetical protein